MSGINGNYLESHCSSSKQQTSEPHEIPNGSCNGVHKEPNRESHQGYYRKRRSERVITQMIFDVFVAPVLAVSRTVLSLSLNLIILFGLAAACFTGFIEAFLHATQDGKYVVSLANCKFILYKIIYTYYIF